VSDISKRADILRRTLRRKKIDALLVTNLRNVRYLTGFTGSSAFALVTRDKALFYTDFRYTEQAEAEVKYFERGQEKGKRIPLIGNLLKKLGIKKLGFESSSSYEFYEGLKKLRVHISSHSGLIEDMREVKDSGEIAKIREAIKRAEEAFLAIKPKIKPGVTEQAIALSLEEEMKKRGCKRAAFDIIIASGKHSSMPHAAYTAKKLEKGDFVIIDWGGEADGYYSDMTRTLLIAGPDMERKKKIYDIVNRARQKAVLAVSEGAKSSDIDNAAREYIKKAGYGELFGHGTGHGIGLDVHEGPRISFTANKPVKSGMVFSIEPGIYVPGFGGVRIEDLVLVEGDKGRLLTSLSRKLEIING
jgi:Xaa-Pro aminopeptidase